MAAGFAVGKRPKITFSCPPRAKSIVWMQCLISDGASLFSVANDPQHGGEHIHRDVHVRDALATLAPVQRCLAPAR